MGFDVTQSIFEIGVAQRLDQLTEAIAELQIEELTAVLQTQAEVFLGLAESLNLQGFKAIAQATLFALEQHPDQIAAIAEIALADFRAGQAAVLAGDRTQGGFPSQLLQQLAQCSFEVTSATNYEADLDEFSESSDALFENIWGGQAVLIDSDADEGEDISIAVFSTPESDSNEAVSQSFAATSAAFSQRDLTSLSPQVRISIKHLEEFNYLVGELLTNYNRQLLQAEKMQSSVQTLQAQLKQHKKRLDQLRSLSKQANPSKKQQSRKTKKQILRAEFDRKLTRNLADKNNPLNHSYPSSPLMQSLLDDMVQLAEVADAIELFVSESSQSLESERQLLTNTRSTLIEARMLPLGEILNRLPSVLQQLETLHSKQVTLELRGSEVLVDKVVAEKLYDPLLHLVRNAFDHGIESTRDRQQQGKPTPGSIEIYARSQGRYLIIEVRDDGKGLDFEQILQRAIESQLVSPIQAETLTESQLIDLLFEPGFSTASQVSDLSGRGIGLDVVRNQIQSLRGSVTIQSQPGEGTTFVLQIPLNLTLAPLLVCEAGGKVYALLDDVIEQIIIPQPSKIQERNDRRILQWGKGKDTKLIPLYSLAASLNYSSITPPTPLPAPVQAASEVMKPIILLRSQDGILGLEVDQLIGEQELVIRPLGSLISAPTYIHGASILADQRLALVIDGELFIQIISERSWNNSANPDWTNRNWKRLNAWMLPSPPQMLLQAPLLALPAQAIAPPANPKILVVEDSITTRQGIVLALQKTGYQVIQAQNGQEALGQLQHHVDIQLVLCDLEMPGMNGFEFLKQVQQNSLLRHLPIVILTSRNEENYRTLAMQLGAAAYMTKPYLEHKLLALVANLLDKTVLKVTSS